MKKYLIALTMVLALGWTGNVAAGGSPKFEQELVDSVASGDEALEAYSDTTDVADTTVVSQGHRIGGYSVGGSSVLNDVIGDIGLEGLMGMGFVLLVLMIIFVVAPVLLLGLVLFFVYRNRKQKMRLAEMAMKQGQPIPDQLLVEHRETDDEVWQKGIRQTFLGVGLLAFFGYVGSSLGIGVGILVTCLGLGKLVIVKTSNKKNDNGKENDAF
ncbi:MAG: hypothetical protein IJ533_10230 [Prevotella sp.]|nr:hypothetical protein [Prevotella sp.]MBQ8488008.1 hypothetical protein [Prevotella sp.]